MTTGTTATSPTSDAATESVLDFYKITSGGQHVYRNRGAAIRDVYVPDPTADQLGNPDRIQLAVLAGGSTAGGEISGAAIESVLDFYKVTGGGQRVYRNRGAAIRDLYVPRPTADRLGNPDRIKVTIRAA